MNWFYKILDKILWSNTLYYPGCLTKIVLKDVEKDYEKLLEKLGIDFIKLPQTEYCCWSPVLRAGMRNDFEEIKQKNIQVFQKHAVGLIITNCPACYNMLKFEYKLSDYWIKVEHISQTIYRKKKKIKKLDLNDCITYHDPCHLWRHSNVYKQPRETIQLRWYNLKEMKNNKELSSCCWGWGGLINNNPELSQKIAQNTLSEADKWKFVSPCPMCYYQFKQNAKEHEVVEYSHLFLEDDEISNK